MRYLTHRPSSPVYYNEDCGILHWHKSKKEKTNTVASSTAMAPPVLPTINRKAMSLISISLYWEGGIINGVGIMLQFHFTNINCACALDMLKVVCIPSTIKTQINLVFSCFCANWTNRTENVCSIAKVCYAHLKFLFFMGKRITNLESFYITASTINNWLT